MKKTHLQFDVINSNNQHLANLCGPLDENLRQIEQGLSVKLSRRGHCIIISGEHAEQAHAVLKEVNQHATKPLSINDIQIALVEIQAQGQILQKEAKNHPFENKENLSPSEFKLHTRQRNLRGRTPMQCSYINDIQVHDMIIGAGPAGTGKTYLAVACAVDALERCKVERIILTRPAVEAGERLGFLPGDLTQKIDPYLRPLYDSLYNLLGYDRTVKLLEKQMIEVAPLAYMRGRTLNNAFIILDEAQNTTHEQMKMFLTRIGFGSKAVITGDPSQIDLPKGQSSGLNQALDILKSVTGIAITHFTRSDIVRHPLVASIVDAYTKAEKAKNNAK